MTKPHTRQRGKKQVKCRTFRPQSLSARGHGNIISIKPAAVGSKRDGILVYYSLISLFVSKRNITLTSYRGRRPDQFVIELRIRLYFYDMKEFRDEQEVHRMFSETILLKYSASKYYFLILMCPATVPFKLKHSIMAVLSDLTTTVPIWMVKFFLTGNTLKNPSLNQTTYISGNVLMSVTSCSIS